MRGYLEGASFREWILRLTSARSQVLDEAALLASARVGIAEGLLAGVTTFADTSSSGVVVDALTQLQVRGVSYQEVFGPDPRQCAASMEELQRRVARLSSRASTLVRLGVSPHAPYTVSDDLYRAVADYAAAERLPLAAHIAESQAETQLVCEATGPFADGWRARGISVAARAASPVALLEKTGVLSNRPLLIHCVHLTSDDVGAITRSGSAVAHCPASNAKFGHGIAPLRSLLANEVPVGLGSDSVASNNRMDLLDDARLAALLAGLSADSDPSPAAKVLELATLGGARAIGLPSEIGSLEVGKSADLAAFHVDAVRDEPVYDPATALVFGGGGRRAIMVLVAGVELVRDGRLCASLETDFRSMRESGERLARFALEAGTRRELDFSVVPPRVRTASPLGDTER